MYPALDPARPLGYNGAVKSVLPRVARELVSDLTPEALAARVATLVGDGPPAPFAGSVTARGFAIDRMRTLRGSVPPVVRGRFRAASGATSVTVVFRPAPAVKAFMAIWLAFLAAVAAAGLGLSLSDPIRGLAALAVPAALAALSWRLMLGVFAADSRWALEHLLEVVPELRPAGARPGGRPEELITAAPHLPVG